ncbi:MAG: enoyl-CoA hydratase/3-hydroxyacyl-CoA dehydrogenase [Natronomonas sp.]|jgi:enoyl-CoA hydratase/3-hydroxyacyl-CoA dehydrogenase
MQQADIPNLETLRLEYPEPNVAHLVLDRPDNLNSVNETVLGELDEVMDLVENDADARALLITGAGDAAFCGGADLQFMGEGLDPFEAVEFSRLGQRVFGRLAELSVPVVAGIDGFALGGGMELATCVDLCVAGESAEFGQPELNLGILPAWGGTQRLSRLVGERRAREIVLTAERYDAETMYDYGFVNEVVDDEDLEERALELAATLAEGAPLAQKATKAAMLAGRDDLDAGLQAESDAFGLLWTTEDTREGIDAFHDRREPDFEGR